MANHVHALSLPKVHPSRLLKSMKGSTAHEANRILGLTGKPFWQAESYDHWVRDEREHARIAAYIGNNPVKAGLAAKPEEYGWSPGLPAGFAKMAKAPIASVPLVWVVPVTGTPGEGLLYLPLAAGPNGLAKQSFALIDHLRSIDKRRVRRVFGVLPPEEISAIDEGMAVFLGLSGRLRNSGASPVQ